MAIAAGVHLGPYEILTLVGSGGMGEVYKARDTRLDRIVAIKVLPESFASDAQFKERFEREARTISQLDHPHICTLHDVGEQHGRSYLVMQYLEGETLEARLKKGRLPLDQALQCAIQIAQALDAAHRTGIVHRDLKPGNVMLTKSGAKLLDFGLAKTATGLNAAAGLSMLPTTPPALTAQGTILGTFQYMAPEQLEGLDVDARTDIFAFGAVVYEMLTGDRAFAGKSQASLIGAILHANPGPVSAHVPQAPASLDRVINTCLAKDPQGRWQSAADLWRELKWIAESPPSVHMAGTGARLGGGSALAAVVTGLVLGAILGAGLAWTAGRRTGDTNRLVTRFSINLGPGEQFSGTRQLVAISSDGRRLAYVANRRLYVRSLDQLTAVPVRGVEGETLSTPFFSPDGQWLGYVEGAEIKKVSIGGGAPVPLCGGLTRGLWGAVTWQSDDSILFGYAGGVWRLASGGGTPEAVVKLESSETTVSPVLLPGNRAVLYTRVLGGVVAQAIGGGAPKVIIERAVDARYLETGHLVYAMDDTLWAVQFDPTALKVNGAPVPLVENVRRGLAAAISAQFSVSSTGSLVYVPGGLVQPRVLVWLDRQGREAPALSEPRPYEYLKIAPDGSRVALSTRGAGSDIWIWDSAKTAATRLTFESENDHGHPVWSPDGQHVMFSWALGTPPNVFQRLANSTGQAERFTNLQANQAPLAFSRDGKTVVIREIDPKNGADLRLLSLNGSHEVKPLLGTRFNEVDATLSPDGQWLAYQSDETGRFEIYVRPFPNVDGGKWQVSNEGGTRPLWARSGRELFYLAGDDRRVMAALIQTQPTFSSKAPTALFEAPYLSRNPGPWDVAADGRFLAIKPVSIESDLLVVVENWSEELKQRVPTK